MVFGALMSIAAALAEPISYLAAISVIIAFALAVLSRIQRRLRHTSRRKKYSAASVAAKAPSQQPTDVFRQQGPPPRRGVPIWKDSPAIVVENQNASCRELTLKLESSFGQTMSLTMDRYSTGETLHQRAKTVFGESFTIEKPNGEGPLDLSRPLTSEGLKTGDILLVICTGPPPPKQVIPDQPCVVIEKYTAYEYRSPVASEFDRFEVTISARREREAVLAATVENTDAEFAPRGFTVAIHGEDAEYVFRRGIQTRLGKQNANSAEIATGFELCPARCTAVVKEGSRIEITLRPQPQDWLTPGTLVRVEGLKEAPQLNGLYATVTQYIEKQGKFAPARYAVQLESGEEKRIKRKNLRPVKAGEDLDQIQEEMEEDAAASAAEAEAELKEAEAEEKAAEEKAVRFKEEEARDGPIIEEITEEEEEEIRKLKAGKEPATAGRTGPASAAAKPKVEAKPVSAMAWSKQRKRAEDAKRRMELID